MTIQVGEINRFHPVEFILRGFLHAPPLPNVNTVITDMVDSNMHLPQNSISTRNKMDRSHQLR